MTTRHLAREYSIWLSMKTRCYNQRHPSFRRYGARGVTVCDSWRRSYDEFLRDMGPAPDGMSLDRIDNAGNYEPGNCRWADRIAQARNTSRNRRSEWLGRPMLWIDIAMTENVDYNSLRNRLHAGMEPTAAINECRRRGLAYRERAIGRMAQVASI